MSYCIPNAVMKADTIIGPIIPAIALNVFPTLFKLAEYRGLEESIREVNKYICEGVICIPNI